MSDQSLKEKVFAASPAQLILMLMDSAVEALSMAAAQYRAGAYDAASPHLAKARPILAELLRCVKPDVGEIGANMQTVYASIGVQLDKAVTAKDAAALDHALRMLTELRDTWMTISR
jgi:flagellar biosynthetic protein FliS